jgi:hypothetical protein
MWGCVALADLCFGPLLTAASTARSNRSHPSGRTSRSSDLCASPFPLALSSRSSGMAGPRSIENERQRFFAALGEAISEWAWVEHHLFHVYVRLVRPELFKATSAAFHAVINLNSRLAMADAAASFVLTKQEDIAEWTTLKNKLGRLVKLRNEMAHMPVYTAPQLPSDKSVYLAPTILDFGAERPEFGNPKWVLRRVQDTGAMFERLAKRVAEFAARFPPPPTRPGEFHR